MEEIELVVEADPDKVEVPIIIVTDINLAVDMEVVEVYGEVEGMLAEVVVEEVDITEVVAVVVHLELEGTVAIMEVVVLLMKIILFH